jgi:YfiH family protein
MKTVKPDWPAPANVQAFTTLRQTWGFPNTDYKCPVVREDLTSALSLPNNPIWLNQVHGNQVVEAAASSLNADADASFTSQPETVCVIMTADCIPVLVCDKAGKHVAAIHAGWRGLASGVIEETLKTMQIDPENLLVWLGPAIGPNKFEVGEDVHKIFTSEDVNAESCFKPHTPGKWLADLHSLARLRLQRSGVNNVYSSDYCTHTHDDMFYSYRRDGANSGRMASVIWIGKQPKQWYY